ncbi:MAG: hypothetical protein D6711_03400 [Chloroflexi bacterium]|nr:MAG: hypothetical protein D6711_03400 [Chloroflexota bacterium]
MSKRITVKELAEIVAQQNDMIEKIAKAVAGMASQPQAEAAEPEPAPKATKGRRNAKAKRSLSALRAAAEGCVLPDDRFRNMASSQIAKAKLWAKKNGGASVWWTYSRNKARDYVMFRKAENKLAGGVLIATIDAKGKVTPKAADLDRWVVSL